jgi:hypothetical protein
MTSFRQIAANRRNALRSTRPQTESGKQHSRLNAVRHGLTAETVIGSLEDAEDYKAFEGAVTEGYDAQTAVERELVLRLASLLWRLRRATAIETDLLQLQAEAISDYRTDTTRRYRSTSPVALFRYARLPAISSPPIRSRWECAMAKRARTTNIIPKMVPTDLRAQGEN